MGEAVSMGFSGEDFPAPKGSLFCVSSASDLRGAGGVPGVLTVRQEGGLAASEG